MAKPPEHVVEVRIHIGGEDWRYVRKVLMELLADVEEEGRLHGLASGGGGGGHSVTVAERTISPEEYEAELLAWHEAERKGGR